MAADWLVGYLTDNCSNLWPLIFNCGRLQTSGPWTSCSWRNSTMNACCPTSPPCRTPGVLRSSKPQQCGSDLSFILLNHSECLQRASGERRKAATVLRPATRLTPSVRNTWRRWGTSAGHTSGAETHPRRSDPDPKHPWIKIGHARRCILSVSVSCFCSFLFASSLCFAIFYSDRTYSSWSLKFEKCKNFLIVFCKNCFSARAGTQHNRPSASVEVQVRHAWLFFPLTISQMWNISRNNLAFDFGRNFRAKRKNNKPVGTKVSTESAVYQ